MKKKNTRILHRMKKKNTSAKNTHTHTPTHTHSAQNEEIMTQNEEIMTVPPLNPPPLLSSFFAFSRSQRNDTLLILYLLTICSQIPPFPAQSKDKKRDIIFDKKADGQIIIFLHKNRLLAPVGPPTPKTDSKMVFFESYAR